MSSLHLEKTSLPRGFFILSTIYSQKYKKIDIAFMLKSIKLANLKKECPQATLFIFCRQLENPPNN